MDDRDAPAFEGVLPYDRQRLVRRWRDVREGDDAAEKTLERDHAEARALLERRLAARPPGGVDPELPIAAKAGEIAEAIREHQVVVVCGETGSGKSTQLPRICLDAGRGTQGFIGHTQPRRIAARSVAARVARELGTEIGGGVGYKVRFTDETSPETWVKVMTDGVLLAEIPRDRRLLRYDTLIVDEAHERSLNIDFLLGYLRRLLPRRRDLRVVITSATIDPGRFAGAFREHGREVPVIDVPGRTHPVEVRWRPPETPLLDDLSAAVAGGVEEALEATREGDVLCFLPGEAEIRDAARTLRGRLDDAVGVLPLYARLSAKEQDRVFAEPGPGEPKRRVVLATNVAETSITVPRVRAVVDAGLARMARWASKSGVQMLPVEPISQASAKQRAGRCGRTGPGVCIRLYEELDHAQREAFTPPEILRTNLASVILRMKSLRLGEVRAFPFIDPPRAAYVRDGLATLHELAALDERGELTEIGRRMAELPVDPRHARMLVEAERRGCLGDVLVIASALAVPDPRERPHEARDKADEAHARFESSSSDFTAYLGLWDHWHELREDLSWNGLKRRLRGEHVNFVRMREWIDLHRQLSSIMAGRGRERPPARRPGDRTNPEAVHRALLAGLLANVGLREDRGEYRGTGGTRFRIFPGSALHASPPRWVMAAEIVETQRRYARTVARIDPQWIEDAGGHLLKRSHREPRWDAERGQVVALERATLDGLEVYGRRPTDYARIDRVIARELFIHHALVGRDFRTDADFFAHNGELLARVQSLEARLRRRDLLLDASRQFDFYDARIPAHVASARSFAKWLRKAERHEPGLLHMTVEDLVDPASLVAVRSGGAGDDGADEGGDGRRPRALDPAAAIGLDPRAWPDRLRVRDLELELAYRFEPGAEDDGVTLVVPVEYLNQVELARLEWLVPGLLEEKVLALVKSLPKQLRRAFVPAPETAAAAAAELGRADAGPRSFGRGSLLERLGAWLSTRSDEPVRAGDFDLERVPPHLRMTVRVVGGEDGDVLDEGRDLARLRARLGDRTRQEVAAAAASAFRADDLRTWDFGDLPETVRVRSGVHAHPMLVDRGDAVALRASDAKEVAARSTRAGVRRLLLFATGEELEAQVAWRPDIEQLRLDHVAVAASAGATAPDFDEQLMLTTIERAYLEGQPPVRTEAAFHERLETGWDRLWPALEASARLVALVHEAHRQVRLRADALEARSAWAAAVDEARARLAALVPADWMTRHPVTAANQLPRYLAAVLRRLERGPGAAAREQEAAAEIAAWEARIAARRRELAERAQVDPRLDDFRWLLEEYRVSCFAQDLGTQVPVSAKRLAEAWTRIGG